ncbi:MAG: hypothetical protein QW303_01715 [Nitrososphaerota archaeon]
MTFCLTFIIILIILLLIFFRDYKNKELFDTQCQHDIESIVYDKVYENLVYPINPEYMPTSMGLYNKPYDLEYAYRDLDGDTYDSKFSIMSGDNFFSTFSTSQQLDNNPLLIKYNGDLVHLAQRDSPDDWRSIRFPIKKIK